MGMVTTLKLDTSLPLQDAVDFMNTTYEQTKALFLLYDRVADTAQKQVIADECNLALKISLALETNILFPALAQISNRSISSAAMMSQSVLTYLIDEIASLDTSSLVFDIKIKLLAAHLKDHIKVMRARVFRYLSGCDELNLYSLRTRMESFKNALIEQL